MINFSPTTQEDIEQIAEWTKADPYHNILYPEWWLTGNGFLSFRLNDEEGPVCYVRIDKENKEEDILRLHVQFAPKEVVSKRRLVIAMISAIQKISEIAKSHNCKGLVFASVSPTLIKFMARLGFNPIGDNDYKMLFEA